MYDLDKNNSHKNKLLWYSDSTYDRLIWGTRETYENFIKNGGSWEEYEMIALMRMNILEDAYLLNFDCEIELPSFEAGKYTTEKVKSKGK